VPAAWLATQDLPISSLERFPGNARRGNVAEIRKSIRRHGQYRAIVVRVHDGHHTVLAGNHTADALEAEGCETARCELIECTDDEARRINLADNRLSDMALDDSDALVELLSYLDEDYEGTGWTAEDVSALLGENEELSPEGGGDPDDVPEPPAEPVSAPGDLYWLGKHRLLVGDSTDPAVIGRLMGGDLADMIWTDPPYNVAVTGGTHDPRDKKNHGKGPRIANDAMGDGEFRAFLIAAFAAMAEHLKPGGAVYACHADTEGLNFRAAFGEGGLELHQVLIWVKQQFVFGRSDYHWQHEPILYGWKPGAAHAFHGERNQSTIWQVDRPMRSAMEHPTQKPTDLVSIALQNSSRPGELILDPFGGSGSTLITAHQTGRVARLCELDPRYADVIIQRWMTFSGEQAVRENGIPWGEFAA
jgi:DNA modification methylase